MLGARIVTLQLGGTESHVATDAATLDRLITTIATSKARVVVENGQLRRAARSAPSKRSSPRCRSTAALR